MRHHHESYCLKSIPNIAYALLVVYQRAIIVPMRTHYGKDFFGLTSILPFLLMCLWAGLTHDEYMGAWIGFWLLAVFVRFVQTRRLLARGAMIHSWYDGWPDEGMKVSKSEKAAKLYAEPILVALLGGSVLLFYKAVELPSLGLPVFLLIGAPILYVVERVKEAVWDRRLQEMQNARLEQEALVRESRQRYGE
jgi:hypothetical protein